MKKMETVMESKAKRKVKLGSAVQEEKVGTLDGSRVLKGVSSSKDSSYTRSLRAIMKARMARKLYIDGNDFTPKLMESDRNVKFAELTASLTKSRWASLGKKFRHMLTGLSTLRTTDEGSTKQSHALKTTIDDILGQMSISVVSSEDIPIWKRKFSEDDLSKFAGPSHMPEYIKIYLRETEDFVLFEKGSSTVLKNSREAKLVEEDNQKYDYLTVGKGRVRRKADAESQTNEILYKTRYVNTEKLRKVDVGTFVSNYDMYDTYAELEKTTTSVELDNEETMEITTYKTLGGENELENIVQNPNFTLAVMLTQRLLAGNVFTEEQKRFRNMYLPDPLDLKVKYSYTLRDLWSYANITSRRRAVSCMSWCPNNGDILAVAYGTYTFIPIKEHSEGFVCIWSIKNPVNPERVYKYKIPVVSVEFSQFSTQLLGIGLHNGTVEVRDITNPLSGPVAVSHTSTSQVSEPITQIKWIASGQGAEKERLLTVSTDGKVMKYRVVNGPHLIGFLQMKLERVVGSPEGLPVFRKEHFIEANRNTRPLTLTIHPKNQDLYYVLTDEGCLHKCSTNYPQQHLELLQVHEGSVFCMDFSPWSAKIFLTCGSDWCIRIWLDGIFESLIKLTSGVGPVHCAYWSPTHSTIIVSVTRESVQIWDIRRSILKPVAIKTFKKDIYLTIAKFSNCGRSLVVGNEYGDVHMCALEDMPFPPYFQYQELENAIFKAIRAYPELTREVKSMGYLGYPNKDKPNIIDKPDVEENPPSSPASP